ncbi:glycosyltransferase 87 family protein [Dictyobacter arantiisoli]|uniref:Uncharacterized protein n=1 Tax=Dictyobacter arantiisoli TaxID=2014874 RepID=A0A5A5THH8_9CHLR|nr:glycosyltransferase 87 family protein [Dictyobacter arantiisoli]GCF11031.1 hypothetical protein KDI_45950 [Dictyobacter arantiisoli]
MNKMIEKGQPLPDRPLAGRDARSWWIVGCMLAFVVCILLSVTPIARIGHMDLTKVTLVKDIAIPTGFMPPRMPFLTIWGKWLPSHFSSTTPNTLYRIADLELLFLIGLAFVVYAATVWLVGRRAWDGQMGTLRRWIWIGALMAGVIYLLTPGMASKDLFVYADYGNLAGAHLSNPYFSSPLEIAPHDILTRIDDWSKTPSAYGPVWVYVSGFFSLVFGDHPLPYFYIYRLLALVCHLVNIWLIGQILRRLGRSERTITLGMLLYAWNPLMLFEGPLGAHNDMFMSTLMLLGVWLCVRADQRGFTRLKHYWPALVLFTLAVLVKFTSIPLVLFFLLVLAGKSLGTPHLPLRELAWKSAIKNVVVAGVIFAVIALAAYLPFWIGHSLRDIVVSFSTPPSSSGAENSLMRVGLNYVLAHKQQSGLLMLLMRMMGTRRLWSVLDILAMGVAALVGAWYAWRTPSLRTLVLGSLSTMAVVLLVTPWFYSWYVIWLIALIPLLLAFAAGPLTKALATFCLTFSATAFVTYLSTSFYREQLLIRYFLLIVPALVIAALVYWRARGDKTSAHVKNAFPIDPSSDLQKKLEHERV